MKQSKFNILVVPPEDPSKSILYNTFHDHRIILDNGDDQVVRFLGKIDRAETLTQDETETANALYELGVLLDDEANEKEIFDRWYFEKIQNPKGLLNLILVTTMACNLRCPYCYEKDQLDNKRNMTIEMADKFVSWIKDEVRQKPIQDLEIVYFGGEPLMNKAVVFAISERLQHFCKQYGINYHGKMVTNGVLMTPDVASELRRLGVNRIKVTLDGDKDVHDTTRITSSGRGSFDQIWYNLEHANDNLKPDETPIRFIIGGNFLDETYNGFFPLLDRLASANFKPYIESLNLKPVQDVSSSEKDNLSANPCDVNCFNEKNTGRMIRLREALTQRGLPASDGLNLGPCDFYRGDSYTVDLNGYVYPCIAFADNQSCAIGHIENENPTQKHQDKFKDWERAKPWTEDCYDCSFLPVCVGGCRATAYSNGYDWNSTVCEKQYFSRMSAALAKELLGINSLPLSDPFAEIDGASESAHFIREESREFLTDFLADSAGEEVRV